MAAREQIVAKPQPNRSAGSPAPQRLGCSSAVENPDTSHVVPDTEVRGLRQPGSCLCNAVRQILCAALSVLPFLLSLSSLEAQDTAQAGSQTNQTPFLQFRTRALGYTGAEVEEAEPTNLDEVRLGWFGPADPENPVGGQMWWAVELAIREANEQGGFCGRPFRLIPAWSENPWGNGVPLVFRMVYDEKVWALLGGVDGASTHLAEQVVAKACLPLVSPVSTDKSVNLAGVPWMFSCAPGDHLIAPVLAEAMLNELKNHARDKLVVFSATDHDSRMTAREILKALSDQHRSPDFRFEFQPGEQTFETQLAGAAPGKESVFVLVAGPEDSARLVTAIRQRLGNVVIFGTHQMGRSRFAQLAGKAADDVRFPLLWIHDESNAVTRKFIANFRARFGEEPDYAAALSFDATRMVIAATREGGLSRARIREALVNCSPWQGITGQIQWDGTGQNSRKASRMGTIKNGRIVPETPP